MIQPLQQYPLSSPYDTLLPSYHCRSTLQTLLTFSPSLSIVRIGESEEDSRKGPRISSDFSHFPPFFSFFPFSSLLLLSYLVSIAHNNMSTQEIQSTPSNTSTSSPSNSSQPAGECVVCGEKTFKCCGPCSATGMDWMFFCSAEHQKLVSTRSSRTQVSALDADLVRPPFSFTSPLVSPSRRHP